MANRLFLFRPDEISLQLSSKIIWQKRPPHRSLKPKANKTKQFPSSRWHLTYKQNNRFQRAFFHASYKKLNQYGKKAQRMHLSYITRNGTGIAGGKAKLFGSVSKDEIINFKKDEKYQFRFRLSPENGDEVDIEKFTKKFMQLVEKETDKQLRWIAACHYNTQHPHAHIIVSGIDTKGNPIRFERYHLSQRFKELAEHELTRVLGFRGIEKTNQLSKVSDLHLTQIDYSIKNLVNHENFLSKKTLENGLGIFESKVGKKRIEFLKHIGIVSRCDQGYKFNQDWFQQLTAFSRNRSFFYARKHLKYVHKTQLEFYRMNEGKITGHLSWKGTQKECAVAIETLDGKAYFCPCDMRADKFRIGDIVSFDGKQHPKKQITRINEIDLQRQLQSTKNIQGFGLKIQKQLSIGLEY